MSAKTLTVFDPSMCCSTGVCGPDVDQQLVRFSADVEWLGDRGVTVERFNLAQEPGAFTEDSDARELLKSDGESALPLFKVDGDVISHGQYPRREQLAEWFDLDVEAEADDETDSSSGCCSGTEEKQAADEGCC
ncbi:MAG: arsenite efflux transporter metallochaperone ArsD [Persicimonas sp.]